MFYVLVLLYNPIKLSMMLPLREPPGGFCDNGCYCYFFLTGVFSFPYYFSMPLALHSGFPGPWRPPPDLSSSLATFVAYFSQAFPSLVCLILLKVLWFWVSVFHPQLFLPSTLFPHFHAFVTQMRPGTRLPGSSYMSAFIGLSLPATACPWTTDILVARLLFTWLR